MKEQTLTLPMTEYVAWLRNKSDLPEDIQDIMENLARSHRHYDEETDTLNLTKEDVISSMVVESFAFLGNLE